MLELSQNAACIRSTFSYEVLESWDKMKLQGIACERVNVLVALESDEAGSKQIAVHAVMYTITKFKG